MASHNPGRLVLGSVGKADSDVLYENDSSVLEKDTPLGRGLAVIQAFLNQRPFMSIAEVSLKTGISRAAVGRCLYTLGKLGFVRNVGTRHFALTTKVLELGHLYLASAPLASTSTLVLQHISSTLNESSSLAILDGDDILCIAYASSFRFVQTHLFVGSRLPAYCTSIGRVLLSHQELRDVEEYLARAQFDRHTPSTKVTAKQLRHELEAARSKGYVVIDQELEIGLRSIAVPIYAPDGSVPAALGILTDAERVTVAEMERSFLPVLQDAASELALLLI
ncbi:MAG: helix-turn-helix domain-containing protein [Pseudogulbenkiania sp.]|nr:helix-turn-helix domain-containing protein [Pseudogulbenkiania sp.]